MRWSTNLDESAMSYAARERSMNVWVLVETQSEHENGGVEGFLSMACAMAEAGKEVHLWLIQNGVLLLRQRDACGFAAVKARSAIRLYADALSLQQRSIQLDADEANRVSVAGLDELVSQLMATPSKTIWH